MLHGAGVAQSLFGVGGTPHDSGVGFRRHVGATRALEAAVGVERLLLIGSATPLEDPGLEQEGLGSLRGIGAAVEQAFQIVKGGCRIAILIGALREVEERGSQIMAVGIGGYIVFEPLLAGRVAVAPEGLGGLELEALHVAALQTRGARYRLEETGVGR